MVSEYDAVKEELQVIYYLIDKRQDFSCSLFTKLISYPYKDNNSKKK